MDMVKKGPSRTSLKWRLQDDARLPESQRHDANSATSSAFAALEHKPKKPIPLEAASQCRPEPTALSKCGANGRAEGAGGGKTEVLGGGKGGKASWP